MHKNIITLKQFEVFANVQKNCSIEHILMIVAGFNPFYSIVKNLQLSYNECSIFFYLLLRIIVLIEKHNTDERRSYRMDKPNGRSWCLYNYNE